MDWYENARIGEAKISACGDDCAACPRYLAKTEQQKRETAELWHRIGWRDRVVSGEEISCEGCGSRGNCSYGILPCRASKGVKTCADCGEYPCGIIRDMLEASERGKLRCRACVKNAEWALLVRAFYEKESHLPGCI